MQEFDTEKGAFVGQNFIAGAEVGFEDEEGNGVDEPENAYLDFEMVQPQTHKYQQKVFVSFHNGGDFFYTFKSDKEIGFEEVVRYFEKTEGFSPEKDSVTFVDDSMEITI